MHYSHHIGALCVALALSICSIGQIRADDAEKVGRVSQRLASPDLSTWTPWPMPLSVCFVHSTGLSKADFNTIKSWAITGLQQTWGRVHGVSFTDDCTATHVLNINLQHDLGGSWGNCGMGVDATCTINGSVADGIEPVKAIVVHEVGHALGMLHEHQRLDSELCPFEQGVLDGCTACINASPSCSPLPTCSAADYNTCFLTNITGNITLTADACGHAQSRINDRTPIPGARRLTVNEDPISIMNYCSGFNGRDLNPPVYDLAGYMPTVYDLLGLEMLYPVNRTYRIGCTNGIPGCFSTAVGAIVRLDGMITSEWTARGALDIGMRPTGVGTYGSSISASSIPAGQSNFTYQFIAPRGEILTGAGTITKSNSMHSALVVSIFAATL